jgi:hypothetical protein
MRGSPPIASTATTSRRCARWRGCIAPRKRGTSSARPSAASSTSVSCRARSPRTRRSSCTHSSVSSKVTCSAASTKPSMHGAG